MVYQYASRLCAATIYDATAYLAENYEFLSLSRAFCFSSADDGISSGFD
jgi:hypothetical protein